MTSSHWKANFDKPFKLLVHDIFETLDVWVFDEDAGNVKEFLGRVRIPLLQLPRGEPTQKLYRLKTEDLQNPFPGGGVVHLKLWFRYKEKSLDSYAQLGELRKCHLEELRQDLAFDTTNLKKTGLNIKEDFQRLWGAYDAPRSTNHAESVASMQTASKRASQSSKLV